MNELMLGETAFVSTLPFAFPPITAAQDTCEIPLSHLASTGAGVLLIRTSCSDTALAWVMPKLWKGVETREGGGGGGCVTLGRNGVPKVYARSRFVIVIFGNVGEGCRMKS